MGALIINDTVEATMRTYLNAVLIFLGLLVFSYRVYVLAHAFVRVVQIETLIFTRQH
jgi:hypothetical protein